MITSREAAYMARREPGAPKAGGFGDLHDCLRCGRRASYQEGEECGECVSAKLRRRDEEAGA